MSKKVSVNESLFEKAKKNAEKKHCSVDEQFTHWIECGIRFELLLDAIKPSFSNWGDQKDMDELIKFASSNEGIAQFKTLIGSD